MARQQEQNRLLEEQVNLAKLEAASKIRAQELQDRVLGTVLDRMRGGQPQQAPLGLLSGVNPATAGTGEMIGAASAQHVPAQAAPGGFALSPDELGLLAIGGMKNANTAIQAAKYGQDVRAFNEMSADQRAQEEDRRRRYELEQKRFALEQQKFGGLSASQREDLARTDARLQHEGVAPPSAPATMPSYAGPAQLSQREILQNERADLVRRGDLNGVAEIDREIARLGARPGANPAPINTASLGGGASRMSPKQEQELAAERAKDEPKQTFAFRSTVAELDRLINSAQELRNHPGLRGNYGLQGVFPNIPQGNAANASVLIDKLLTQVGLNTLTTMRQASPTGGAVGNVTEKEWPRLENSLAALKKAQSYDQVVTQLDQLVKIASENKRNITEAYVTAYPQRREQLIPPEGSAAQNPSGGAIPGFRVIRQR
jgi:hypothetical protein